MLEVLRSVALELERPAAQVALAWVMARPGVSATIIGASKLAQLAGNIAAAELKLSDEQMTRLNEVSRPPPGFSAALTSPVVRRMVFGGNNVRGWSE